MFSNSISMKESLSFLATGLTDLFFRNDILLEIGNLLYKCAYIPRVKWFSEGATFS